MDHFRQIPMFGAAWMDMLESWTTLAYLAAVTERVRLGTLVTGVTYRNVAHLGKIVATLDVLSGGARCAGSALGWFDAEHRAYGWPFPSLAERYALLEDALQVLPLLWGKGTPEFHGRTLDVPEALLLPAPAPGARADPRGWERRAAHAAARRAVRRRVQHHRRRRHRGAQGRGAARALRRGRPRPRATVAVTQLSTTLVGPDAAAGRRRSSSGCRPAARAPSATRRP